MKLLESVPLEQVVLYIKNHAREFDLDFRLETYSCKMISNDRKEWRKNLKNSSDPNQLQPLSPPEEHCLSQYSTSPFCNFNSSGRLRHSSELSCSGGSDNDADENVNMVGMVSRKTLFNLVAVLNMSYGDYDFSQTKSERFSLVNPDDCIYNVNAKMTTVIPEFLALKDDFWRVVENEMKVKECILYSYIPEYNNDPFTEDGCIWAFNYMFWNRGLKRILFLCCRALRTSTLDISPDQFWVDEN